jgi:hypothetical protein
MYYIYALYDVRSNLPFYIGKGKTGNNRHNDHFNETIDNTENRHKLFKINYLRDNGFDIPVIILADHIQDETLAYDIEVTYIKQYGRENIDDSGILTNVLLDSRSPPSWKGKKQSAIHTSKRVESRKKTVAERGLPARSAESRKRLSDKTKGDKNPFYGKTHSMEFSKAQSAMMQNNQFNSQKYKFTSPSGIEYIVIGFAKFCRDNNLTTSTMEKGMYKNKWAITGKCAGWRVDKMAVDFEKSPVLQSTSTNIDIETGEILENE